VRGSRSSGWTPPRSPTPASSRTSRRSSADTFHPIGGCAGFRVKPITWA
jgi:hypothetical protein